MASAAAEPRNSTTNTDLDRGRTTPSDLDRRTEGVVAKIEVAEQRERHRQHVSDHDVQRGLSGDPIRDPLDGKARAGNRKRPHDGQRERAEQRLYAHGEVTRIT